MKLLYVLCCKRCKRIDSGALHSTNSQLLDCFPHPTPPLPQYLCHWRTFLRDSMGSRLYQVHPFVLKTLECPLDSKEIKPVNPKGDQPLNIHCKDWCWSWSPILWPHDGKSQLTGKAPDAGEDWGKEEKGITDEMVGWHHWLNGHECEQTLGALKDREAWRAAVHGVTEVGYDWLTGQQQWDNK